MIRVLPGQICVGTQRMAVYSEQNLIHSFCNCVTVYACLDVILQTESVIL